MSTLPLFEPLFAGKPEPTGPPLSGADLRDSGIELVLAHTPEEYRTRFIQVIKNFPRGQVFSVEDVRHFAGEPPISVHRNAIGALMRSAAKKNLIVLMNKTRTSERATRRAGRCAVWKRI